MKLPLAIIAGLLLGLVFVSQAQIARQGGGDASSAEVSALADAFTAFQSSDFVMGDRTNSSIVGLALPYIEGRVTKRSDTYEGGIIAVDLNAAGDFTFVITNGVLEIGYLNLPDTTGAVATWSGIATNASGDVALVEWGDATPTSFVPVTALAAGDVYEWKLESRDNVLRYTYIGPQSEVLPEALGGNATTNAMAVNPRATLYYPQITSQSTNLTAEHSKGTAMQHWMADDIHLFASDGKPATTNLMTWADWNLINMSGGDLLLTARDDWLTIGFEFPYTVTNGTTARFRTEARGPSDTNFWIINALATTTVVGGGGSPPASTLADGTGEAWWPFDDVTDTVATNGSAAGSSLNLTTANTDRVTPGQTGQIGNSWTNAVDGANGTWLTNYSSTLECPANGAITYAGWVLRVSGAYAIARGPNTGSANYGWHLGLSISGSIALRWSTNGTSYTTSTTSHAELTTGTWHFLVVIIDDENDRIGFSLDATSIEWFSTGANDINRPNQPLQFLSAGTSSTLGMFGKIDDWVVYSRAWTQSEIEEAILITDWDPYINP